MKNPLTYPIFLDLTALTAGVLLTGAFAPFERSLLAFIALSLLLYTLLHASPSRGYLRSLFFGFGFFGTATYWVYISIHEFGNTPLTVAILIAALLVLISSMMQATFLPLLIKCFPRDRATTALFAFPVLWVAGEFVRTWFLTGFPWVLLGYSQLHTPLAGFAPIFSVYGLSLITAMCSACLLVVLTHRNNKTRWVGIILFLSLFGTGQLLTQITWSHPTGKPVLVSSVQGNIPMKLKWSNHLFNDKINTYINLTHPLVDSALVVWPETAIPGDASDPEVKAQIEKIKQNLPTKSMALISGIITGNDNYNSLMVLNNGSGTYNKRHLVPLGEYFPFRKLINAIVPDIPAGNLNSGAADQPNLIAAGLTISPFICYEIIYPELVRKSLTDATLLLTASNDAWFGKSSAAEQHLEMAQMRSLETGRYQIFSTNNGVTAIIDNHGNIVEKAPPYEATVLSGSVIPMKGITPWVQWGLLPLIVTGILFLWAARRRTPNSRTKEPPPHAKT